MSREKRGWTLGPTNRPAREAATANCSDGGQSSRISYVAGTEEGGGHSPGAGVREDPTGAVEPEDLASAEIQWSADPADLAAAEVFIIAVPTPIDEQRRPDLGALRGAARTVGGALSRGDVVVLTSVLAAASSHRNAGRSSVLAIVAPDPAAGSRAGRSRQAPALHLKVSPRAAGAEGTAVGMLR